MLADILRLLYVFIYKLDFSVLYIERFPQVFCLIEVILNNFLLGVISCWRYSQEGDPYLFFHFIHILRAEIYSFVFF